MGMDANGTMQQKRKQISGNMTLSSSSVNNGNCSDDPKHGSQYWRSF